MPSTILPKKTEHCLEVLKPSGLLADFYLAGGTGLALQLHHRLSQDLDFFSQEKIDTQRLLQKLKDLGPVYVEQVSEGTLNVRFETTNLSFLEYHYPLLFSLKNFQGLKLADPRDIGCMKISAIANRGKKKDFIDLYFLLKEIISLDALLKLFHQKYRMVDYSQIHLLKSLVYFQDAEKDPMPKMIKQVNWDEIKRFLIKVVKEAIK